MNMPFQVTFDKDNKIVIVKVSDKATKKEHYSALEKALQLCYKKKIKKLLVNLKNLDTKGIVSTVSVPGSPRSGMKVKNWTGFFML